MARPCKKNPNGSQISPCKTPETITKLEQAFALGASNREACLYANIAPPTLYRWYEEDQELKERMELLKETPVLEARQSVRNQIKGVRRKDMFGRVTQGWEIVPDGALGLRYLERVRNKEFSLASDTTMTGTQTVRIIKPALLPSEMSELDSPSTDHTNTEVADTE